MTNLWVCGNVSSTLCLPSMQMLSYLHQHRASWPPQTCVAVQQQDPGVLSKPFPVVVLGERFRDRHPDAGDRIPRKEFGCSYQIWGTLLLLVVAMLLKRPSCHVCEGFKISDYWRSKQATTGEGWTITQQNDEEKEKCACSVKWKSSCRWV